MSLTNQQKSFIDRNKKNQSAERIARKLKIDVKLVEEYLAQNPVKKTPFYYNIFLVVIPFLLLFTLEVSLQVFSYGEDIDTFIEVAPGYKGVNFDLAKRYFRGTKSLPNSIQDIFREKKPENGFRVFVLGGSSGAGYPFMPMGSFSRYIKRRLEIVYPYHHIEVVNVSLTAVNSYTINDVLPDVLNNQPDLILIYAGHNEYYGALGVGSLQTMGSIPALVRLNLNLQKYKTYQLVRNLIEFTTGQFVSGDKPTGGTLMARMAKEREIPYNSDLFEAGVNQFSSNLNLILEKIKGHNVPVIISTLTSNLKGLKPFISKAEGELKPAIEYFDEAEKALSNGKLKKAEKLYRLAKDYDMLRFRAPEKINDVIKETARKYKIFSVDADKYFCENSPNGITGNNLMTDHLHPTLEGYQLIGKLFYEEMMKRDYLPQGDKSGLPVQIQHRITVAEYPFSKLDSVIAEYKLKILYDDYPFRKDGKITPTLELLKPQNFIDTTAMMFVLGKTKWDKAQLQVSDWYLKRGDYKNFVNQKYVFLYQFPVLANQVSSTAQLLLEKQLYDDAYKFLELRYRYFPDAFSTKWMGIIKLSKKNYDMAKLYLQESLKYNPQDYQTLYNLAGAFSQTRNYEEAVSYIERAIQLQPGNQAAVGLKNQLLAAIEAEKNKPLPTVKLKFNSEE